jgi:hypothetical protein
MSAAPSPPPAIAADHLALPLRSIQALGEHQHVPLVLLALDVVKLNPSLGQSTAHRRAPPRPANALGGLRMSCRTFLAQNLVDLTPGAPFTVKSGEP